jgi:S1-C subfamily serine protease
MTDSEILKRKVLIAAAVLVTVAVIVVALFSARPDATGEAQDMLHEIRTFDTWSMAAAGPYPYGNGGGQAQLYPGGGLCQVAAKTPIFANQAPPVLIKELGIEVVPASGGKVKITGVMGNSWADKAKLKADDIIMEFDMKSIKGLEDFKGMINRSPPEKEYKIKVLRAGRVKKCLVMVGEGEMGGFLPIAPTAQ